MASKSLYKFGNGQNDGENVGKDILGGKGANLADMSKIGLNVPAGFTIPTSFTFQSRESVIGDVIEAMNHIKGDSHLMPLVSVRSGAPISMPGMMDTVLNVGLTTETIPKWYPVFGRKVAYDSYCRLIRMMGESIKGIDGKEFDIKLKEILDKYGLTSYYQLHSTGYFALSARYKNVFKKFAKVAFPQTLEGQLRMSIDGVFQSWYTDRAIEYRKLNNIPASIGTACTVQRMVFGNKNKNSMTGVMFTRNPNDGSDLMTGEYLVNAQGEDVVNGSTTPKAFEELSTENPVIFDQLQKLCTKLETHYNDMQDIEFTVEDGVLFVLQTRTGKRTAQAAFKIARDFYNDGLIEPKEVLNRIKKEQYYAMKVPVIDPDFKEKAHFIGLAAGGGVVSGKAVTSSEDAVQMNEPCILVTDHTTPDDVAGMNASKGILTRTGGMTCHAAVVGRGMNKTCVVGANSIPSDIAGKIVTINGHTGEVWVDIEVPMVSDKNNEDVKFVEDLIHDVYKIRSVKTVADKIVDRDIISVRDDSVDKLQEVLEKEGKFDTIYLTLENDSPIVYHEEDEVVRDMFGEDFDPYLGDIEELITKVSGHKIVDCAKRVVVITPKVKDSDFYNDLLRESGYLIPVSAKKVEDLMSGSVLYISDEFVSSVVGSHKAYDDLVKCLETAGKHVEQVPVAMKIEEAINQYL